MAFKNSILAGDTLVRTAIQSEGFTTGVDGWRIERDGDAELNDVVVRGRLEIVGTDPDAKIVGDVVVGNPTLVFTNNIGTEIIRFDLDGAGDPQVTFTEPSTGDKMTINDATIDWRPASVAPAGALILGSADGASRSRLFLWAFSGGSGDAKLQLRSGGGGGFPEILTNSKILVDGEGGWHNLPLNNLWVADTQTPQYRKMCDGSVMLRGWIKDGTSVANTTIATLPAGYRPVTGRGHYFLCAKPNSNTSLACIDILGTGLIRLQSIGSATKSISLDNVRFMWTDNE